MISAIINTSCLLPGSKSSQGVPMASRAYILRNWLLPRYIADPDIGEVIVAGTFEEGEGYIYVPCDPVYGNWGDALVARHAGFEASHGDTLIFQHDDHVLDPDWWQAWSWLAPGKATDVPAEKAVCVPARWTRLRGKPERLNNGAADGYLSGHCSFFRRKVIERCRWIDVPPVFTCDIEQTKRIQAAGFDIAWSDTVKCWDVEFGGEPWK